MVICGIELGSACNTSSQLETESLKNRVKESRLLLSIN